MPKMRNRNYDGDRSLRGPLVVVLTSAVLATRLAYAGGDTAAFVGHDAHRHRPVSVTTGADSYQRSTHDYAIPGVRVIDEHGTATLLPELLKTERPIILNFMFTTCTAVCPITSATFAKVQERLREEGEHVQLVSLSIDPEHDTPAALNAYANKHGAGPNWHFYTGLSTDMRAAAQAFAVYRGGKMNHVPATFLRVGPASPWVRLDGLVAADEVIRELHALRASQ